jgi:hypothetical protein
MRRSVVALMLGTALTMAACTAPPRPASRPWAHIDRAITEMGPNVGFLAARVSGGSCRPVHAIAASRPRPTGSQFKLFVLGALARRIAAGQATWDQTLTVTDAVKSLGNGAGTGALQFVPSGTVVPIHDVATKMISISDNTAADMLIGFLGRQRVEAQVARWAARPVLNQPFLTTREMLLLHYTAGLADAYLKTPRSKRAAFLASSVDPRPLSDIASAFSQDPRYIDTIEWFASPRDICTTFAGLQRQAKNPRLAPLSGVLSIQDVGLDLPESQWSRVWYKGGSEPGVLALGWLATNRKGETFVVQEMVSNPDEVLATNAINDLIDLAREAFGLLG